MNTIPLVDLQAQYKTISGKVNSAVLNLLERAEFIGGEQIEKFENEFASLYGVKNCISVGNGTDSLYIIMKMLGIGPGDQVITVANSWISSSETITQTGAKVIFVEPDPLFYTIDSSKIEEKITPNTKAIIPVHLYGQVCDMDEINQIAKRHNLFIVEDCAQSHFSKFKNVNAGLFGDAASFSFYPGKNLGAYGDAGAIITNNTDLALNCKRFARHGALVKHQHVIEGINSRLDAIQAAVLRVKLEYILEWTKNRQERAAIFSNELKGVGDVVVPAVRPNSEHSFHLYVIQTEASSELSSYLNDKGIQTAKHYPTPLPFLKAYEYIKADKNDYPVSLALSKKILSIPLYPELSDSQQSFIIDAIKGFFN